MFELSDLYAATVGSDTYPRGRWGQAWQPLSLDHIPSLWPQLSPLYHLSSEPLPPLPKYALYTGKKKKGSVKMLQNRNSEVCTYIQSNPLITNSDIAKFGI